MKCFERHLAALALVGSLAGCVQVDHFTAEPARYDGLYFASEPPSQPELEATSWRVYALYGFVSWSDDQIQFAGRELGKVGPADRPMNIVVETELTFWNAVSAVGVNIVTFGFGGLVFVPRHTEVIGWPRIES